MMQSTQRCVSCNIGLLSSLGPRLNYLYAWCLACGTIQLAQLPSRQELTQAYAEEYAAACHFEENADSYKRSAFTYN